MRIRVGYTLGNRDETTNKDERILNGFVDVEGPKPTDPGLLNKRPGLVSRYTLGVGQASATAGQLVFGFSTPSAPGIAGTSTLIGIRGDVLTRPVT